MGITLPLDTMTTDDKLRVLEQVWEALARTPEDVPAPSWHADVLSAREKRIAEGSARFEDWDEAKERIRKRTR